jgi:AraC-like DNA-binding protein
MEEFTVNKAPNLLVENITGIMPGLSRHRLFDKGSSSTIVRSGHGRMVFQEFPTDIATIWTGHYNGYEDADYYAASLLPALELQFMFGRDIEYELAGHGRVGLREGYFNMRYVPFVENRFSLRKGASIFTFDVHYTLDYLEFMLHLFPGLGSFLEKVYKGQPAVLREGGIRCGPELLVRIYNMLGRKMYTLDGQRWKVGEELKILLFDALEACFGVARGIIRNSHYDDECLMACRQYLLDNPAHDLSLKELANKFGMNEHKLKQLFPRVFGTSVFDFHRQERINHAALLLLSTDDTIDEIAGLVGYENHRTFAVAFYQLKGVTPGEFRKRR